MPYDPRHGGYNRPALQHASACAYGLRWELRDLTLGDRLRHVARLPVLLKFVWGLPRLAVPLSNSPAGALIAEHLSLRRCGVPRFRLAQGVLHLPADFPSYLRGHRRQAVRTNIHRARDRGMRCRHVEIPHWTPQDRKITCAAPVEHCR
jgi:hypothetical protein